MKLRNINDVQKFLNTVDSCEGDVYLVSNYGDKYNLHSKLSQYIAVAAMISDKGDELELFCQKSEDESKFVQFFMENPNIL